MSGGIIVTVTTGTGNVDRQEKLFLDFAEELLKRMKTWPTDRLMDYLPIKHLRFTDTRPCKAIDNIEFPGFHEFLQIDTISFFAPHIREIDSLPESQACVQELKKAKVSSAPLRIRNAVREAVARHNEFNYPDSSRATSALERQELLDALFALERQELLDAFQEHIVKPQLSGPMIRTLTVPLVGVEWKADSSDNIDLGSNLDIVRFTPELKTKVWNSSPFIDGVVEKNVFANTEVALQSTYCEVAALQAPFEHDVIKQIEIAVTALRLLQSGNLQPLSIFQIPLNTGLLRAYRSLLRNQGSPYELRERDTDKLKPLIAACAEGLKAQGLSVALRRFNQAYERRSPEDKIIDLIIALDSTLLHGVDSFANDMGERGEKLFEASDIKLLFGDSDIKLLLVALYKARNFILHDGFLVKDLPSATRTLKKKKGPLIEKMQDYMDNAGLTVDTITECCEHVVREILRTYVERICKMHTLKAINDEIEKAITINKGKTKAK